VNSLIAPPPSPHPQICSELLTLVFKTKDESKISKRYQLRFRRGGLWRANKIAMLFTNIWNIGYTVPVVILKMSVGLLSINMLDGGGPLSMLTVTAYF